MEHGYFMVAQALRRVFGDYVAGWLPWDRGSRTVPAAPAPPAAAVSSATEVWPPPRPYPLVYFIEPASLCNAACVFCHYPQLRDQGKSTVVARGETFAKALDLVKRDCALRNVRKVSISLTPTTGDILVNRNWGQYLDAVADIEIVDWIDVVTNGILLRERDIETLVRFKRPEVLNFSISVGGLDRATYKAMFGVDKFEAVRRNVNRLMRALKDAGVKLNVAVNMRVPDAGPVTQDRIAAIFNEAGYRWAHYSVLDTFKDVPADVPGKLTLKMVAGLTPRDNVPCGMLDSGALNFSAEGEITACGCHYSQDRNDKSLRLGTVDSDIEQLVTRRAELVRAWRQDNVVPTVCRKCQHYHLHDGLQSNGLMLEDNLAKRR